MRALVTGASGFVGQHLVRYLYGRNYEVWASFHRKKIHFPFPVHWVPSDLTQFIPTLELIRRSRPHQVYHLAAQTLLGESWKDPEGTFEANTKASIFLMEAVLRHAPKARMVLVSSAQVYGASFCKGKKLREDACTNPVSPYAGSKRLMELAAIDFSKKHGLDAVIARVFNQIGKGLPPTAVFSQFCRQIVRFERKRIRPQLKVGNMNVVRDFIHVEDAVRAYELLARLGKKQEVYNVGRGTGVYLPKVLDFLGRQSRVSFKAQKDPSLFRKNDLSDAVIDPGKLKRLGWRPKISVWTGLREVLAEWRERTDIR